MKEAIKFSQLSLSRKTLVRICQALNFGSILNLRVTNSEVSFNPQPDVIVDIRLDADLDLRAELELDDFGLRPEVIRLFAQIDAMKSGIIENIFVRDGIPRRVILRRPLSEAPQKHRPDISRSHND